MSNYRNIVSLIVAVSMSASASAAFAAPKSPLKLVGALDLERYLGTWYEVARYQHSFEKNIVGATAEYSLRSDGRIDVLNSGFKKALDGKFSSVKAVAWRPDEVRPGALKVKFFGLFTSDYLVFGLDEEGYSWALVGNDSRKFLWFLSRTPTLPEETLAAMRAIAEEEGYDLSGLFMVPQKER